MNDWPEKYETDAEERRLVAEWVERNTAEAMAQYTRMFASLLGLKAWIDYPEAERLQVYLVNPPFIWQTGEPTPDQPEVYPQWASIASDDQGFYQEQVEDYLQLMEKHGYADLLRQISGEFGSGVQDERQLG